ncbi:hypothetical protein SS50377_21001 [Spironucleus salmonicida]|uniref:Uncharacterized protein n=1 Tax=Spironucleus salmonicida TaxID=348837 RepID=A0A9P8M188_9EUKA|nr:hypothetical protein SS50377_21001 [Spironucleus salmonicida]
MECRLVSLRRLLATELLLPALWLLRHLHYRGLHDVQELRVRLGPGGDAAAAEPRCLEGEVVLAEGAVLRHVVVAGCLHLHADDVQLSALQRQPGQQHLRVGGVEPHAPRAVEGVQLRLGECRLGRLRDGAHHRHELAGLQLEGEQAHLVGCERLCELHLVRREGGEPLAQQELGDVLVQGQLRKHHHIPEAQTVQVWVVRGPDQDGLGGGAGEPQLNAAEEHPLQELLSIIVFYILRVIQHFYLIIDWTKNIQYMIRSINLEIISNF